MDIASIGFAKIELFVLVLARTAGIFTLVPIFGSSQVPAQVRVTVAVSLALIFTTLCLPQAGNVVATDVFPMLLLVVKEAIVGFAIGFITTAVFAAIQMAGDFIDMQAGFSFAQMLDPVYGSQTAVAGRVHHLLAGLLFFVTNAHHIMLQGLADSFTMISVGQMTMNFNPGAVEGILALFASLFGVAIRLAAPVVAAVFLADLAFAIISRAVPQMNVLMVGMPIKLGVGLVGMAIALPISMAITRSTLGNIGTYTSGFMKLLAMH